MANTYSAVYFALKFFLDPTCPTNAGYYRPIEIVGEDSDWALGFMRERGPERLAVVVARFPAKRQAKPGWEAVARPPEGRWRDVFRGREIDVEAPLRDWLGALPVAVLTEG